MTSPTCLQALRGLCAAWDARGVYGANHSAFRQAIARCVSTFAELTREGACVTLALCEDGIIADNEVITDPSVTGLSFLEVLTANGATLIRVGTGVTAADIEWVLRLGEHKHLGESPSNAVHLSTIDRETLERFTQASVPSAALVEPEEPAIWNWTDREQTQMPLKLGWTALVAGERRIPAGIKTLAANITSAVLATRSGLLPLLELKDHDEYTYVHGVNVGLIASALGRAVGLPSERLQQLTEAALLHDVGKRLVPLTILNKKGRLDENDQAVMRTHPVLGALLLSGVRGVTDIGVVAAYEHHQRIDGGGYPEPLRPRRPALTSQLVQIADIFDALRSDRPYRAGLSTEEVLNTMAPESGRAFDRDLFEVLKRHVVLRVAPPDTATEKAA